MAAFISLLRLLSACDRVNSVALSPPLRLSQATGASLEDARAFGWVTPATAAAPWYEGWEYVDLRSVIWAAVPAQGVSWLAMVVVVAFSSCLDVAAIEMEMGKPLDYDHELQTVRRGATARDATSTLRCG